MIKFTERNNESCLISELATALYSSNILHFLDDNKEQHWCHIIHLWKNGNNVKKF